MAMMMYPGSGYRFESNGQLENEVKELKQEVKELKEQLEIFQAFMKKNSFMDFKILKLNEESEKKRREEGIHEETRRVQANIFRQMIR
jgi:predicted RNase H-like nuclease (RuvC/YqgF family)